MGLGSLIGFKTTVQTSYNLPALFRFGTSETDFVYIDVMSIYTRILTAVLERTEGVPDDKQHLLYDNCVASESSKGLVTLLAKAMYDRGELYLMYDKSVNLIIEADAKTRDLIKAEYKEKAESKSGIYVTFKEYRRSDMLKIYSVFEYCTVASLNSSMNLSKAIQFLVAGLRGDVNLADSADVVAQAQAMVEALKEGRPILGDAKDVITTAKPDLTATTASMQLINEKRSFYLGLPAEWVGAIKSGGSLNDSGKGESRAVERGLKGYYFPIIKPVLEKLLNIKTTFKSEDFDLMSSALEALKTFDLVDGELVSKDNQREVLNKLFGFQTGTKGDPIPKQVPTPTPTPALNGSAVVEGAKV